jgi:hypothetical protein
MTEADELELARLRDAVRRTIDEIESKRMGLTTDRNSPCLKSIRPDGQQECYLVLSEEERAKGFVRPVRRTYRHAACRGMTRMGQAIAETFARNPTFYSGTFCVDCGAHFNLIDADGKPAFHWIDDEQAVGS